MNWLPLSVLPLRQALPLEEPQPVRWLAQWALQPPWKLLVAQMTKKKDFPGHSLHDSTKCAVGIAGHYGTVGRHCPIGILDELDANKSGDRHCTLPLGIAEGDCCQADSHCGPQGLKLDLTFRNAVVLLTFAFTSAEDCGICNTPLHSRSRDCKSFDFALTLVSKTKRKQVSQPFSTL